MIMNKRNPIWANASQTMIDCEIEHPTYGWVPFTASPDDVEEQGRAIFAELSVISVAAYAPPTTEQLANAARIKRNLLLSETDWTQAADVPQATKDFWAPYRQALRDVPEQSGFPTEIVWPVKP